MNKFLLMIGLVPIIAVSHYSHAADTKRMLCFGDSITQGGAWVSTVGRKASYETINAGLGGRKAAQAKAALAEYLAKDSKFDKIILFLGVNDLPARDTRPGDEKVAGCVKNMGEAIDLALKSCKPKDIILVAPCNVNPEMMGAVVRKEGYDVTPPLLAKLEVEYKELAKKKGVSFVSLLDVVGKNNYKDGLHPNGAGDAEIAKAILDFLDKK